MLERDEFLQWILPSAYSLVKLNWTLNGSIVEGTEILAPQRNLWFIYLFIHCVFVFCFFFPVGISR